MSLFKIYILTISFCTSVGDGIINGSLWKNIPQNCGTNRFSNISHTFRIPTSRITKGTKADLGQFPWMVAVGETGPSGIFFYCGGALINRYYVLSAAHCEETGDIARIGDNYVKTDPDCDQTGNCAPRHQDIKIKRYFFEDYCRLSAHNDLMLIELEEPAKLNDYVQPVCLLPKPLSHEELLDQIATMSGWGVTSSSTKSKPSNFLMYFTSNILHISVCENLYGRYLTKRQICIGETTEGKNICNGDSGGPAIIFIEVDGVQRAHLIGITSFGPVKCEIGTAVFTYVPFYLENILKNVVKS